MRREGTSVYLKRDRDREREVICIESKRGDMYREIMTAREVTEG